MHVTISSCKELNLKINVIASETKSAPKGDFDPRTQQNIMKLQKKKNI